MFQPSNSTAMKFLVKNWSVCSKACVQGWVIFDDYMKFSTATKFPYKMLAQISNNPRILKNFLAKIMFQFVHLAFLFCSNGVFDYTETNKQKILNRADVRVK